MNEFGTYIIGASGHGKVIAGALRDLGRTVSGFFDDGKVVGFECSGKYVVGSVDDLTTTQARSLIVAVGVNRTRMRLVDRVESLSLETSWTSVIHPRATVGGTSEVGEGCFLGMGVSVTESSRIGCHCIINTNACIDHDCVIEGFTHVACGATLAGGVRLGEGVLIGAGATILPGRLVGAWAVVGAGATVTHDVPPGITVVGTPARKIDGK